MQTTTKELTTPVVPTEPRKENNAQNTDDILIKIHGAFEVHKNYTDQHHSQERFYSFVRIISMYFELGQELTKTAEPRIPEQHSELILITAQDLATNYYEIVKFIRRFRNKCLSYGEDCDPLSNCVLLSGLEYLFKIYPNSVFLKHEDCRLNDIFTDLNRESDYQGLLDDFKEWWDSECYVDPKYIPAVTCDDHWWWDC